MPCLQFLADRQKSDSLYDYDTLYKVWMNRMKIGRGVEIVKMEILQSAPNAPKTKLKESGLKSTFHMFTVGPLVPNFRPFRSTISRFRDILHVRFSH